SKFSRAQRARDLGRAGGILLHGDRVELLATVSKNHAGSLVERRAQSFGLVSDKILGADGLAGSRRDVDLANFFDERNYAQDSTLSIRADKTMDESMRFGGVIAGPRHNSVRCDLGFLFVPLRGVDRSSRRSRRHSVALELSLGK